MKQEVMKIWVDALRSGEYTQGVGCLKSTNGNYCCLGVLCELYDKNNEVKLRTAKYPSGVTAFNNFTASLPHDVMNWAGMCNPYGSFIQQVGTKFMDSLSSLNDAGSSFLEIADIIEQNVERL